MQLRPIRLRRQPPPTSQDKSRAWKREERRLAEIQESGETKAQRGLHYIKQTVAFNQHVASLLGAQHSHMGYAFANFSPVQSYDGVELFDGISLNLCVGIVKQGDQARWK
jgi:hypothetical protein